MEMCRVCLTTGKDMIPIDAAFVINYNVLTNLEMNLSDELPLYTCNTCSDSIKFCTEFRQKCIASDLTLKQVLFRNRTQNENKTDTDIIKQEVKIEECEDYLESVDFEDYLEPLNNFDPLVKTEDDKWSPSTSRKKLKRKVKKDINYKLITKKNICDVGMVEHCRAKKDKNSKLITKLNICNDGMVEHCRVKKDKNSKLITKLNICDDGIVEHCGICSKKFKDTVSLWKHFEHHKLEKACGLCIERFIDYTHLLAHRITHLPEKQKKCHICSKRFSSPDYLECHFVYHHKLRGEGGKVLCKHCLVPFDDARRLYKHIWSVHSAIKYNCNACGKGFRQKQALRNHIKTHNAEKTFECDLCDYACRFSSGVKEHKIRKHTQGRVHCKTCGRAFPSQEKLDKHICKNQSVICPICGIHVHSRLSRHMWIHTDEYRFKCERCPKQFKSSSSYKTHLNKHDGTRPFRCPYCPMSFFSQTVLIKHRRTHTGEKPYVCKICKKGFTGNNNLKVHMKVHGEHLIVKKNPEPPTSDIE